MKNVLIPFAAGMLLSTAIFAQKTITRDVSGFDKVSIGGGFDKVTFKEGRNEGVVIISSGPDLEKVETKTDGNHLMIGMKKGAYTNTGKIEIEVTYQSIKEINNSGSTDIIIDGTLKGDAFTLNSSGSGDLKGSFDVEKFNVNISGSADVEVFGKAEKQHYAISGSGDINASRLKGESADVAISGSGDVNLNVSGRVKTAISGSGDVQNKGSRQN